MNNEASENRIPWIDPDLPEEEQGRILRDALDFIEGFGVETGLTIELSVDEVERLRSYSRERGTSVRRLAVEFLIYSYAGEIRWEDLEAWTADPDRDVRSQVMRAVGSAETYIGKLCSSEKPRCAKILVESIRHHPDEVNELRMLVTDDEQWLDTLWMYIGPVLDSGSPELWSQMTMGLVEYVLRDRRWGPDDPHVRPWIEGTSVRKKMSLLAVSRWLQVEGDNLRGITEALAQDLDPAIAQIAKSILLDHSGRFELKLDDYRTVQNWLVTRSA